MSRDLSPLRRLCKWNIICMKINMEMLEKLRPCEFGEKRKCIFDAGKCQANGICSI